MYKAPYAITNQDAKFVCMLGTHVDDILWANMPEVDHLVDFVLAKFQCRDFELKNVLYCGKEVVQLEDFTIIVCSEYSQIDKY